MPSRPDLHYYDDDKLKKSRQPLHPHPQSHLTPRLLVAITFVSVIIAIVATSFAVTALRRPPRIATVYRCGRNEDAFRSFQSKSLAASANGADNDGGGEAVRPKVVGLVGVFTGFSGNDRRDALRSTWFPADSDLQSLERATGLAFRFVIGRTKNSTKMAKLRKEVNVHHDFMIIDFDEDSMNWPNKTLAFFKAAFDLFDADFYVKVADDIYLRPDRLATLLGKDRTHHSSYIGCMKKGPVITDPNMKWYESSGHLIGNEYFMHAHSSIYALSSKVIAALANVANDSLRMFNYEDVTVGSWMLAMNVNHEDNQALCDAKCTPTSIAVWDMSKCSGLCNPVAKMKDLHNTTMCSKSPTLPHEEEDDE